MPSRNFTKKREPVFFEVDDDRFDCWPALITDDLKKIGAMIGSGITADQALEKLDQIFELVMQPESLGRMRERMHSRENPIDLGQFGEIIEWLVEVYTDRPTEPSSTSSSGSRSDDGGSSSTDGAQPVASIPMSSMQLDSPTSVTTT